MKWSRLMMMAVAPLALAALSPSASAQPLDTGCVRNNYEQPVKVDLMFWDGRPRIQTVLSPGQSECFGPTNNSNLWVIAGTAPPQPGDGTHVHYDDGKIFRMLRVWKNGTRTTPRGVVDNIMFCRDAEC